MRRPFSTKGALAVSQGESAAKACALVAPATILFATTIRRVALPTGRRRPSISIRLEQGGNVNCETSPLAARGEYHVARIVDYSGIGLRAGLRRRRWREAAAAAAAAGSTAAVSAASMAAVLAGASTAVVLAAGLPRRLGLRFAAAAVSLAAMAMAAKAVTVAMATGETGATGGRTMTTATTMAIPVMAIPIITAPTTTTRQSIMSGDAITPRNAIM